MVIYKKTRLYFVSEYWISGKIFPIGMNSIFKCSIDNSHAIRFTEELYLRFHQFLELFTIYMCKRFGQTVIREIQDQ